MEYGGHELSKEQYGKTDLYDTKNVKKSNYSWSKSGGI